MTQKKEDDMLYIRIKKTFKKIFKKRLLENGYKGFSDFVNECIRKFMEKTEKK